jgi:trigger factor
LEKIAEAEKVEVSKEEIDQEIAKMAEYYRVSPEEIRQSLERQGGERTIENNLKTRKSIEALVSKATVVDAEWVDEAAAAETASTDETSEQPKKATKKKTPAKKAAKATD